MKKFTDRKAFLKHIKGLGYVLIRKRGHATYKNHEFNHSISIPKGSRFCVPLHNRLLKEISQVKLDRGVIK